MNCLELAHKPAHRNFGCGGASGAKLLENTEWGQFRSASESFELVSNSQYVVYDQGVGVVCLGALRSALIACV